MDLLCAVPARLAALGYEAGEDSLFYQKLEYLTEKCRAELLADIHQPEVPPGLFYTLVDMVAGAFLQETLASGGLAIEGMDFSALPKSITEGDVKVEFAGASEGAGSMETRFLAQVEQMAHPPESVLSRFRRLSW